ncbi:hypothetical protein C6502_15015 [Candidatus Poribacteria bacterium]|nr:MAG: hypothetical protein C6502_15015 [Candidatus Poribacteria bacterium]
MRRSLSYFWRIQLAVLLGAAVATAVLTGALLVGDSVRGSLQDLTLNRLGRIDYALVSERFFREELATDLSRKLEGEAQLNRETVPAILLNGTAVNPKSRARASRVQIQGIDERFAGLWVDGSGREAPSLEKQPGQLFPSVHINQSLQNELDIKVGEQVLLSFERHSKIHREFLLGPRDSSEVIQTLRLTVTKILPDRGIGSFGLRPNQSRALNAYVPLTVLQKILGSETEVNAIFASAKSPGLSNRTTTDTLPTLQSKLHRALKLEDLGLILRHVSSDAIGGVGYLSLESTQFMLKPDIIEVVQAVAIERRTLSLPILTYLANAIAVNERTIPYSTITGLDTQRAFSLELTDGSAAPPLADDEILLNEWAATDLGAEVRDEINVSYYIVGPREKLLTRGARFRLKGVVAIKGLAADRGLTPEFPGIHEADDMSEWNAPFPIDLDRIRPKDEVYWDLFRATPKAFVSDGAAQQLWRSRFGDLTAVQIRTVLGADLQITQTNFQRRLLDKIRPEQVGLVFQPVKTDGLAAATGSTDFSTLFIGFSLFLIVSAALLVGLLFRLGVEQRASEIGILLAAGYPISTVRRRFMKEGGLIAGIGGLVGLGGGVVYAWLLMAGLRTWWLAAVGTPFLSLHINPLNLVLGYLIALVVVLFSIGWTVRQLGKVPIPALITGGLGASGFSKRSLDAATRSRIFAFASLGLALAVTIFALVSKTTALAGLFFGSGVLLLIAGLAFFSVWLRSGGRAASQPKVAVTVQMGIKNSGRHPGRSMLCAALVGCACFVIVAVGANRHVERKQGAVPQKESGTGGFALVAESDIPLHHDLNSKEGQFELGFSESDSESTANTHIFPFRLLPGEDASCLNLYRPQKPRILGASRGFIERGGFQFQGAIAAKENPWELLEDEFEPGVIPAIGDYNSAQWILHLGLGDELTIQSESGEQLKLRLVGFLQRSIFQSELLISEVNFKKHFPSQSGYAYFLVQTPSISESATFSESAERVGHTLERALADYGLDVTSTTKKLASYRAVENTYLSTFQTLGGLGLLLGTLGLGIVLLRNALERGGELATLRAFGFRRNTLSLMLLAENGFLLLIGILIGTVSALIAVVPHLTTPGAQVPWLSLTMTLVSVFLVGVVASAIAVYFALRRPLLPALKHDA